MKKQVEILVLCQDKRPDHWQASFAMNYRDIKGCPLGRGTDHNGCIKDLLQAVELESGLVLTQEEIEVIRIDYR